MGTKPSKLGVSAAWSCDGRSTLNAEKAAARHEPVELAPVRRVGDSDWSDLTF